jgi:o-succinylbenzoate---CoA ligase
MLASDGEGLVKGETLFKGYLTEAGINKEVDGDGWYHTRDLGRIDSEGRLTILGRKDTLFISGGENIYPEEIEKELLLAIEEIAAIVVVPYLDKEFGERPAAVIKWKEGKDISNEEFIEKARCFLPGYMVPKKQFSWPEKIDVDFMKPNRKEIISVVGGILE